jgi:hypothetical protein
MIWASAGSVGHVGFRSLLLNFSSVICRPNSEVRIDVHYYTTTSLTHSRGHVYTSKNRVTSVATQRRCKHVFPTIERLFSVWSMQRSYKKEFMWEELVEFRDASLSGHKLGSRGLELSGQMQNNGKKGIRLRKEEFMCDLKWQYKVKVKLSMYRASRPLGLREVEAPTFSDIWLTDGSKIVSPKRRPLFTPRKIPDTHFC